MTDPKSAKSEPALSRDRLAELLNEDLSREYQAIIGYVVYSQVLKGPEFMNIAAQLENHAAEELKHALIISQQIDYLGKMPSVTPKIVKTSENAREMLRFDLENENETIRNYRERVRQCEISWRIRDGGVDPSNPRRRAGSSNRSGHRARRRRSRPQRRPQEGLAGQDTFRPFRSNAAEVDRLRSPLRPSRHSLPARAIAGHHHGNAQGLNQRPNAIELSVQARHEISFAVAPI